MYILIIIHYLGIIFLKPASTYLVLGPLSKTKMPRWKTLGLRIGGVYLMVFTVFDFLLDIVKNAALHARILVTE